MLMQRLIDGDELSHEEYAYLIERGLIKAVGNPNELFKAELQCVIINSKSEKDRLLEIGSRIKAKHRQEFESLKKPYADAILKETPAQLCDMQKYGLQFTFYGDRWFIIHCLIQLVNNGKLKPPTREQRKALHTLIIKNDI